MPFADEMIHRGTAVDLADALETAAPGVPAARLREAAETLAPLSLRERVDVLREAMLLDLGGPSRNSPPWSVPRSAARRASPAG